MELAAFIIFYFFVVFTLSKLSEQIVFDSELADDLLIFFPPLHFLLLTKYYYFSFVITVIAYIASYFLLLEGHSIYIAILPMLVPVTLATSLIITHTKADQRLIFLNFIPPFVWSFLLMFYLAFFHKHKKEKIEIKRFVKPDGYVSNHVFTAIDFEELKEAELKNEKLNNDVVGEKI